MNDTTPAIRPFVTAVPDQAIDDLKARLARTRWPDPETVSDWSQGVLSDNLRRLLQRWEHDYDWRQLRCLGKGRKHRVIPLQKPAVRLLNAWLAESGTTPTAPLFPTSRGTPLRRAAVAKLLARHVTVASGRCPSLRGKNVTPHTLRHTCAMMLLHAGIDTASIALWLGHATIQTTQAYLHADLELKRRSLDRLAPIGATRRPAGDPGLVGEVRDVVDRPVPGVRRSHRLPHRSMRGATVMPTGIDIGAQHPGTLRDRSA